MTSSLDEVFASLSNEVSRIFLIYTHGPKEFPKKIKGVDQRTGRLDIIARVLITLFSMSDLNIAQEVALIVFMEFKKLAMIIRYRDLTTNLNTEIEALKEILACINRESSCIILETTFMDLVNIIAKYYTVVVLHESGEFSIQWVCRKRIALILGAEVDPPDEVIKDFERISIGPRSYLASHVVAYVIWLYIKYCRQEI